MAVEPIPVLMVTYNRLAYSKRAFESIVHNAGVPITLTIWDNHSTDGTLEWLQAQIDHPLYVQLPNKAGPRRIIDDIVCNDENRGLAPALNHFFRKYNDARYVVKVDNDTVLPENWLNDLLDVMETYRDSSLGAVSGTCLRPNGHTFAKWVEECMVTKPFRDHHLHYNSYVLGTGVLINMDMIRQRGLLFEKFPCKISGWTDYTRIAHEWEGWKFAFYSKVPVNLLNLAAEHVLSNDFPEYDKELQEERDRGNAWWESVGGLSGVRQYIADHGGLEPLVATNRRHFTKCDDREERSTQKYWNDRVAAVGTVRSSFMDAPQYRLQEFTRIHEEILRQHVPGKDVLDVGCGWGRMTFTIGRMAKRYVGVDFVEALVEKARQSFPQYKFHQADARRLPFPDASFDLVTAIACMSSIDAVFDDVLKELKRVLRPGGRILWLEEEWTRIDWTLQG